VYVCSAASNSASPCTVARKAPLTMGFFRLAYWCGLPFPPSGDLSKPGIETDWSPESPTLAADSLPLSHLCTQGIKSVMKVQYLNLALDGTQAHQEDASETSSEGLGFGVCFFFLVERFLFLSFFFFFFSFLMYSFLFFFLRNHSFVHLRLHWVFATVHWLSLVVASGGWSLIVWGASHCSHSSWRRAWALGAWASAAAANRL